MPENVGYTTELIVDYCYKNLSHNVLGPTGVNLFMSCSLLDINVCHGDTLTRVVIVHHSGLQCLKDPGTARSLH